MLLNHRLRLNIRIYVGKIIKGKTFYTKFPLVCQQQKM